MIRRMPPLPLPGPDATEALGRRLAGGLRAGDALLLSGPTGAGKSLMARALIRAAQAEAGQVPEDVPSPTYTLVQVYRAGTLELWHADLYRLTSSEELWELGLAEAFDAAACLIEWPDRLGPDRPEAALEIALSVEAEDDTRIAQLSGPVALLDRLAPGLVG